MRVRGNLNKVPNLALQPHQYHCTRSNVPSNLPKQLHRIPLVLADWSNWPNQLNQPSNNPLPTTTTSTKVYLPRLLPCSHCSNCFQLGGTRKFMLHSRSTLKYNTLSRPYNSNVPPTKLRCPIVPARIPTSCALGPLCPWYKRLEPNGFRPHRLCTKQLKRWIDSWTRAWPLNVSF